jgi:hypothetical protein
MSENRTSTPWYREPYVWLLILIPLSAVIYGFIFLRLAIVSNDGLVADDYYRRGKEINRILDRDRTATAMGLSARGALDFKQGTVSLRFRQHGHALLPQSLTLKMMHATRAGYDQHVRLQRAPDGSYFGLFKPMEMGHWYLQVGTSAWRLTGSLFVPGKGAIHLAPDGGG